MKNQVSYQAENVVTNRRRHDRLRRGVALLSAFVMLFTMNSLKMNADTLERIPTCGLEEHVHTWECYDPTLICGLEESDPVLETEKVFTASFQAHKHTADCYDDAGELACGYVEGEYYHVHNSFCYDENHRRVCGLDERTPHVHINDCYRDVATLICGQEEVPAHAHTDACYTETRALTCGQEESAGHQHTDACYTERDAITCGLEESAGHQHTDACYTERTELTCGKAESDGHKHTSDCYTRKLTCGQDEGEDHTHTDACYENVLTCGKSEGEGAHHHSDACYTTTRELTCGKSEGEGAHTHTDACHTVSRELTCGKSEGEGAHTHTDDCYTTTRELTCGQEETEGHTHTDECYSHTSELICGQDMAINVAKKMGVESVQLHTHTDKCFYTVTRKVDGEERTLRFAKCGYWEVPEFKSAADSWSTYVSVKSAGHTHTEACYQLADEPVCGLEEHVHTDACYQERPADVAKLSGSGVSIESLEGSTLPKGGAIVLKKQQGGEALDLVEDYLAQKDAPAAGKAPKKAKAMKAASEEEGSFTDYTVFDISVMANGAEVTDTGRVRVTVTPDDVNVLSSLPAGAAVRSISYALYHVHDGEVEPLEVSVTENGGFVRSFTFETDSFSSFVLGYTVDYTYIGYVLNTRENVLNAQEILDSVVNNSQDITDKIRYSVSKVYTDSEGITIDGTTIALENGFESGFVTIEASKNVKFEINIILESGEEEPVDNRLIYTFHGVNEEAWLSNIINDVQPTFTANQYTATVSDGSLVKLAQSGKNISYGGHTISKDYTVTTLGYFDEVVLTMDSKNGKDTVEIVLKNPAPVAEAGTEIASADGKAALVLNSETIIPEGTELTVASATGVDVSGLIAENFGDDANVTTKWFDISLGDVHEVNATVTLNNVIDLPEVPEGQKAVVNAVVFHVTESGVETLDATVDDNGSVTFTTQGLSPFGVSYTCDFEYVDPETGNTFTWSWPGEGSYSIASILAQFGVTDEISDVSLVRTIDEGGTENVLYLEEREDGWYLTSDVAFTDTFELTVVAGEKTYAIAVTDDIQSGYEDLKTSATQGLSFSVVDKGEDTATFNAGSKTYDMELKVDFTIPSDNITGGKKKYDLEFASNMSIPQDYLNREFSAYDSVTGEESFKYKLVKDGDKYHLLVEYTDAYVQSIINDRRTIGKNSVTIDISVGSDWLQDDGSLKGDVIDDREITITPDKITYPEGTDGRHDISVSKQFGGYDKATKTMKYIMVVSSSLGTAGPITVNDALTVLNGDNITVSNLKVTSVKTGVGNEYYLNDVVTPITDYTATPTTDNTGLTIVLPQAVVADGQNDKTVYLIEYEYTLSGVGDEFESSGKNNATATSGNVTNDGEAYWNISQTGIALGKNGQYNAEDGTITWTINVTNNKESAIPLQDDAFKGMDYSALTITPNEELSFDSSSGTLSIPAGKSYTIIYKTTPSIDDSTKATTVTNKVIAGNSGDGQKTAEPGVQVPAEASIKKELVASSREGDNGVLSWRITIHVPSSGFAAGTTFTEDLVFKQNYNDYDYKDDAYFTEEQKDALVDAFKAYFGDAIEVESYTAASRTTYENNSTTHTSAQLVMKLKENWPGDNPSPDYRGQDIFIEYQTSAKLEELSSDNNSYENTFKLNEITATATYSFKDRVVKMANPGNAADETTANADSNNKKLHWYIQVALEHDTKSITVTDTLPEGLTVTAIKMGDGFYNLIGLVETSKGQWAGETETDWRNGLPAWDTIYMSDSTPGATVDGRIVTINLVSNDVPAYFEENDIFYFYIEAEIDDSLFPQTGTSEERFENKASVSVDGVSYGQDTQTQNVTLKTDIIDKTGDSSVWNAQNGAHELSYAVDINPTGGTIAGSDGEITLTDHIEYYKTVKDNQGNTHKVSLNLKEGSAKLQRKDSNGQWVDIPATEGWGYVLDEDATSPSDNIKAKEIQVFGIPDNTVLRFVYTYNVEVEGLPKNASVNLGAIKNTATLKAAVEESSSHTESKDWKNISSTGTTESTGSMTIVKVQDGNYAISLPDTYFVLEKFVPAASGIDNEGTWQAVSAVGSTQTDDANYPGINVYKTNANGKLIISADPSDLGNADSFQYDTLYRVREYTPHDGYTLEGLSPDAVYFYFGDQVTAENRSTTLPGFNYNGGSTHADDLLTEADTVYMTNKRVTDTITARKQWNSTTLWPNDIIEITVELQKDGHLVGKPSSYAVEHNGKYYTAEDTGFTTPWENPQVLTADNPQGNWKNLDIDTTATNPFDGYRIVETGIRYGDSESGVGLEQLDLGGDQYQWKLNENGEVLFETFGGKVTNGMGTIVNMSKTKLDVEKSWGTQQLGNDSNIQVVLTLVAEERLYAQNGAIESVLANWQNDFTPVADMEPIVLDGRTDSIEEEAWQATFENLDRFRYDESTGRLYEIRYSVQERVQENGRDITDRYLVSLDYNDNVDKVTVTNAPNVGELAVVKNWQRRTPQDGETLPDLPSTIYISIERYYVDEAGVRHNDAEFNADHRGIVITEADTWEKDSTHTYTWAKLFENLQRQINVDNQTYDYKYVIKEDNVPGFTKVITGDDIALGDGKTGQIAEVTVTNVEDENQYKPEYIDIHLEKDYTDEDGEPQTLPDGATATFRLYRYIIAETGTYDMVTKELMPTDTAARTEDIAFNSTDNDEAWTHVLSVSNGTATGTKTGYSFFEDKWTNLPISEIYYNNGTYVKNTYEYYLVEKSATDSAHHAYTALYMSDGSKDRPITIESDGTYVANGNDIKDAEIWNVETDKTFTVRKYWYGLESSFMPGIVVTFKRNGEDINSFGASSNGAVTYGNEKFKMSDGTEFYGYKLDQSNDWNISFAGLEEGGSYQVIEVGYLTKNANNEDVVVAFNGQYFEPNKYNYTENQKYEYDISGFTYDTVRNTFLAQDLSTGNNYGTLGICNAPKQTGGQLYLQKKWYSFTGHGGFADITAGYDGKGDGNKETYIVMQVYQRPYWAFENAGDEDGVYVTDWVEFGDPIKYAVSDVIANGFAWNGGGGQWHLQIESNVNMPLYGYLPDSDGVAKLVMFDYKWVEVGQIPGSDGRTYRIYYEGYPDEPKNHRDDPDYYKTYNGKQIVENYETGLLLLIKEWKANNVANRIFFAVEDDRGNDIARKIYEAKDKSFYGVTAKDVAYIPELGKYVFVLDSSDAVSGKRWELMVRGLDIVRDVDPETHEGYGEVIYTVEEVGVEVTEGEGNETTKVVYAVSDSNYPYNTSYYRRVRFNDEQFSGSTANNDEGERLVAGGLQLDSGRAYNEDGSLTWARVVNSDEPTTQLTVQKKWPGDMYPGTSMKVVLNLEQRRQATDENNNPLWEDDGVTPKWVGDWQAAEGTTRVSVTLPLAGYSGANAWTYTWKGLPIYKVTGEIGAQNETQAHDILWYRVVETSAPGWTSSLLSATGGDNIADLGGTGDKTHPIAQVLTNSVDNTNIHIEKQWTNAYASDEEKSETWEQDQVINWPEGYAIDYKVVRHAWIVSANEGATTTEDLPEDPNREADAPATYEQKHVSYTDGFEVEEWKVDPFAAGQLSADNSSFDLTNLPKGAIITTDDDPPTGLSKNTTYVVEYVYEVVETAITTPNGKQDVNLPVETVEQDENGVYKKENGIVLGDATITNDLTNIEVEKKWTLNGDSYTPANGESVTVQLYRSKERPEGAIPVTPGKITIYVDPMDSQGRTDMADGKIVVTVTGDNGYSKDYTLSGPSYSIQTEDLDDIAVATGSDITYTVTVMSVDGSVIESATVNGDGSTTVGGKVTLTAKAVTPPASFKLNFSDSWVTEDVWNDNNPDPDGPTKSSAFIQFTLSYNGTTESIRLDASNNWGNDLNKDLLVYEQDGTTPISYSIAFNNNDSNKDGVVVKDLRNNQLSPTSFNGADGDVTITYVGQIGQPVPEDGEVKYNGKIYSVGAGQTFEFTYTIAEWQEAKEGDIIVKFGPNEWYGYTEEKSITGKSNDSGSVQFTVPASGGCYVVVAGKASWKLASSGIKTSNRNNAPARAIKEASEKAAPVFRTAASTQSVTILGTNDLTPIDAEEVGDPITLSGTTWSHLWDNLPKVDENGDPIYYYVKELSANIPADATYTGTTYVYDKHNDEDAREGYEKITVTNKLEREEPEFGSVQVTKNFSGITADPDQIPTGFKITAKWTDGDDVEQTRELTITGNQASDVSRTGSGLSYTWTISDLPLNTEVEFEESGYDVTGYSVMVNGSATAAKQTATAAVDPGTATFNNVYTRDTGALEISKSVTVNGATVAGTTLVDGDYIFTVTGVTGSGSTPDTANNSATVKVTITGGVVTAAVLDGTPVPSDVTVTVDNSGENPVAKVEGLPTGSYTVAEDDTGLAAKSITLATSANTAITVEKDQTSGIPTASFTNNKDVANLKLSKTVKDTNAPDETFSFTVILTAPSGVTFDASYPKVTTSNDGTATEGTQNVTSGEAFTVTMKAGDTWEIDNLPKGTGYTITEGVLPVGWTLIGTSNNSGTLSTAGATVEAAFTNAYSEATKAPEATKALKGRNWKDGERFTFTLAAYGDETNAAITAGKVVMPNLATAEATETVKKAIFDDITFKDEGTYYFTITENPGEDTGLNYSAKEVRVKVVVAKNDGVLSAEMTYTDVKDDAGANAEESYGSEAKIFTNTQKPGDLELTKKVVGDGANENKEFEFTIALTAPTGETLAESYTFKKGDAAATGISYTRTDENTKATVTGIKLKANEVFTIKDLPAGTAYTITESDYSAAGYSSSIPADGLIGTITGGTTEKEAVEVTNTFSAGSLTVEKAITGNATDTNKDFNFKVTFTKSDLTGVNGSYKKGTAETIGSATAQNITFESGVSTVIFTLKGGEKVEFTSLPTGTTFEVEEISADQDGYETTVSSTGGTVSEDKKVTGTISSSTAVTASYTNTKNTTTAEATKVWKSGDQTITWPEDVASVEFTLYKTVNGTTTEVAASNLTNYWIDTTAFHNPITITSTTADHKATWSDLPTRMKVEATWYDVAYSVKETKINYTNGTSATADIAANAETKLITNELPKTEAHAVKVWTGDDSDTSHRPVSITYTLTAMVNGVELADDEYTALDITKTVNASGTASGSTPAYGYDWANLPKYNNAGKIISYSIDETLDVETAKWYTKEVVETNETNHTWTATNTYGVGSIVINKEMQYNGERDTSEATVGKAATDTEGAVPGKAFKFGLYKDAAATQPVAIPQDAGGQNQSDRLQIGLEGTGSLTITNLPYGTYYVYELDSSGNAITSGSGENRGIIYTVTGTGTAITINGETPQTQAATVNAVNNQQETGSISVKKTVQKNGVELTSAEAAQRGPFYVALYEVGEDNAETFVAQATLTAGNTTNFTEALSLKDGLPIGKTYKVYELKSALANTTDAEEKAAKILATDAILTVDGSTVEYKVGYNNENPTIERGSKDQTATITNNEQRTDLWVQKRFTTGSYDQWVDQFGAQSYERPTIYFKLYRGTVWVDDEGNPVMADTANDKKILKLEYSDVLQAPATDENVRVKRGDAEPTTVTYTGNETDIHWIRKFTNLPGVNAEEYTIVECSSTGEEYASSKYMTCLEFGNSTWAIKNELTKYMVEKVWNAADTSDYDSYVVKVQLEQGNSAYGPAVDVAKGADGKWSYTWNYLPAFDPATGTDYTYTVTEVGVYASAADAAANNGAGQNPITARFTVSYDNGATGKTEIKNSELIEISGTKTWEVEGEWPSVPALVLKRESTKEGSEAETVTVAEGQPVWTGEGKTRTYTYSNLPKYDSEGYAYTYTVTEASFTLKNESYRVSTTDGATYTVMPADGKVKVTQSGYDITNTELTKVTATKAWDNLPADDETTKSVELTLKRYKGETLDTTFGTNGAMIGELDGTAAEDGATSGELTAWQYTWDNLEKVYWDETANEGVGAYVAYTYKVTESEFTYGNDTYTVTESNGVYTVQLSGADTAKWIVRQGEDNTITNTKNDTWINIAKKWMMNGQEATGPDDESIKSIVITLYRVNGEAAEVGTYTLTTDREATASPTVIKSEAADKWEWKIDGLDKYYVKQDGTLGEYEYYIKETKVGDYNILSYSNGTTTLDNETALATANEGGANTVKVKENGTITVTNSKWSVSLPSTGGAGTTLIYATGAGLLILAAIWFVWEQKKKYLRDDI